ncbi:MAG TPA: IMS domain-containing protein, partial [Cyanophyceae cyanobacterium]
PSIEINNEQFVGALLILQELGEYELVLKLGQPYLGTRDSINLDKGRLGDPHLVRPDIVLTIALSCLELGREQWQQGQYENAATSLETGQEILLREGLFPTVRGEIQADLYKLRPYRILELLALPEETIVERRNGLRLLQDMLQERMGIDGAGDDQSGLSIDDFLRFIQQLRGYLTAAEQQNLFEAEARRPSAVATYLAVYALLGRGFAQRQPALIYRAKQLLTRLGRRQDVHLEQAVCALLLGQTEEASKALELSQEYEPLAFIREHSQGAPDLLPGLCLYGERWLQKSVFPHFRDLRQQKASLKDYFADEQVQAYLENLPVESPGESNNEWTMVDSQKTAYATAPPTRSLSETLTLRRSDAQPMSAESRSWSREAPEAAGTTLQAVGEPARVGSQWSSQREPAVTASSRTATTERSPSSGVSTLPSAQRLSRTAAPGDSTATSSPQEPSGRSPRRQRLPKGGADGQGVETVPKPSAGMGVGLERTPPGKLQRLPEKPKSSTKNKRLIFIAIASVAGVGLLGLLLVGLSWLQKTLQGFSASPLEGEQAQVQLAAPPIEIPAPGSQIMAPSGPLTKDTAQQVIQTWLSTKSAALGRNHQVQQLEQILVSPVLQIWRQRAQEAQQNNSYWQYKHSVEVNSVEASDTNPDQASVDAAVNESAQFYQGGQLNQSSSYNENLRVRYDLVRREGQWFIRGMTVVR